MYTIHCRIINFMIEISFENPFMPSRTERQTDGYTLSKILCFMMILCLIIHILDYFFQKWTTDLALLHCLHNNLFKYIDLI